MPYAVPSLSTSPTPSAPGPILWLGDCRLDLQHDCLVDRHGHQVSLRRQSLAVLLRLARDPARTVSKRELFGAVWPGRVVTDDSLVQCVCEIRRVLGALGPQLLRTDAGRGYRLEPAAAASPAPTVPGPDPAPADWPEGDLDGLFVAAGTEGFQQRVGEAVGRGGVRIAHALSGAGPIAVVRAAHWMTHLLWDWRSPIYGPGIRALSARHRLLRYDGRGCGLSQRLVAMGTLDDEVADLAAVIDAAGLDRFVLIGRSQGGAIAIRYAARHPARVSALVLSGAYARGALQRGAQSWPFDEVIEVTRQLQFGWGQANLAFRRLITGFMFPAATPEQVGAFNRLQQLSTTPQDAATLYLMMAHCDASADLPAVRCPTLVLHSPHDNVAPFEEGRYIAEHIAGARFEAFDSPNHNPLPGEPAYAWVAERMRGFIDAHG